MKSNDQDQNELSVKSNERRKSSLFPNFLRSNLNTRDSINTIDLVVIDHHHDPIPSAEFYEKTLNAAIRPTFHDFQQNSSMNLKKASQPAIDSKKVPFKMGWINGVWIRTVLNIWGVELFIRMGWMVGQNGLIISMLQIILSTLITMVTALSMSAICTNGKIGTGGTYFMISRSLGPEAGAMIGIITYFSMCVLNSLNIVGAAEGVLTIFKLNNYSLIDGDINDIRLIGVLLLIFIAIVPLFGMAWESKTHIVLFILTIISLIDYGLGTYFNISSDKVQKGLVGWDIKVIKTNLWPDYRYGENFYSVLAVFFPMVTGIFAGSGMSGDLKDPSKAIPKGTIFSIIWTSISYAIVLLFLGCTFARYSTGTKVLYEYEKICENPQNCSYGLMNDYNTMVITSLHSSLIYLGIFISALSSSLACYVAAPRMFQAFSKDNLFPFISWFGKGHGISNEPYRGYLITFIISIIFVLIGNLNTIAPIISTFKLASFFLVNMACFHASYINSPSFRPTFKYYNKWLSLIVSLFCFIFMFFFNWGSALITIVLSLIIFFVVNKKAKNVNWGSTTEDQVFTNSLSNLIRLNNIPNHVKNYRPCILLLTGNPSSRLPLVSIASDLTKKVGLLLIGQIVKPGKLDHKRHQKVVESQNGWLKYRKKHAFYILNEANSISQGVKNMLQLSGIGKLKPNVLMIGFKNNWRLAPETELTDYFDIIKLENGCDYSRMLTSRNSQLYSIENLGENNNLAFEVDSKDEKINFLFVPKDNLIEQKINVSLEDNFLTEHDKAIRMGEFAVFTSRFGKTSESIKNKVEIFESKQPKGFIDVWWTNDDGGLTILLPYILSKRKKWNQNKLRIFTVVDEHTNYSQENFKKLIKQFRIPVSDIFVHQITDSSLSEYRKQNFKELIETFMNKNSIRNNNVSITKEDLINNKEKTCKILKIRDLMENQSKNSNLIVMTLPMINKEKYSAPLYMAWLDLLSQEMPPFIFVRGNQSNVLTFYL